MFVILIIIVVMTVGQMERLTGHEDVSKYSELHVS